MKLCTRQVTGRAGRRPPGDGAIATAKVAVFLALKHKSNTPGVAPAIAH
jgi:hypothetical protein